MWFIFPFQGWIIVITCSIYTSLSYLVVEIISLYHPGKICQFLHSSESQITYNLIATATDSSCRLASCCGRRKGTQAGEYCSNPFFAYTRKIVPSMKLVANRILFDGCVLLPTWLDQKNWIIGKKMTEIVEYVAANERIDESMLRMCYVPSEEFDEFSTLPFVAS
ncbi:hypothetical protein LOAG_09140 [Loa loa]|uniref:Uncharacterized protein n=1 Tax=Loa loa TaxID=7209 RepID=A0A1S0TSG9_LOALO|nr:hypothetical protein LOAG_09140 [Loa loa]EFO19356.1 hypothetical protein LOAG_09140 [Loa loa]